MDEVTYKKRTRLVWRKADTLAALATMVLAGGGTLWLILELAG